MSDPRPGPIRWLTRFLRIDAIRSMFAMVDVRRTELFLLITLAAFYALLDGIGLSLLLPVLQYAEDGVAALQSPGGLASLPGRLVQAVGLPLNLITLLILAFVPVILRQVAYYINIWYSALVSNRITSRMRVSTFAAMMDSDPDFFSNRPHGDLTGILLGQTAVAGGTVLQVMKELSIALKIVIYTALLAYLSLPLTVAAVFAAAVVSQVLRKSMTRTRQYGLQNTEAMQRAYAAVVERISLARLVKLRANEDAETANVSRLSQLMASTSVMIARLGGQVEVTADPLLMLFAFAILYMGMAVLGLKLAELGMLLYVLTRLNNEVKVFNGTRQMIASGVPGLSIVRQVTAEAAAANTIRSGCSSLTGLKNSITYDDVWFKFPNAEKPTLRGVSATIEAGSFTALVGRSGAGKSTFMELLPRLRDVTSGSVKYDGIDVRDYELAGLRRGIGYLTQDPMLFNDTIRANLVYGVRREVDDTDIERALEQAYATFVLDLPDGLETGLGDRGIRFSGGERQRLALARVLLDDPSLLILDEPTSALDSESEQYVQAALSGLHGRQTVVVIAHRLATVVAADQLLVLEDGQIVQRGTHAELVASDGAYKQLFESQLLRT